MNRGTWWATVHGIAKSWTGLKRLSNNNVWYNLLLCIVCLQQADYELHEQAFLSILFVIVSQEA